MVKSIKHLDSSQKYVTHLIYSVFLFIEYFLVLILHGREKIIKYIVEINENMLLIIIKTV